MLKDIEFLPTYYKTRHELYNEFYKPCMENSIKYDRITGYFGSSVFLVIHESLLTFILNGGHIRIICSPVMIESDLIAIKQGYEERTENALSEHVEEVFEQLIMNFPNSTKLLVKLIALNVVEIRLAIYGNNNEVQRLMHDKAGIFTDSYGNSLAFRGSINETYKGVSSFGNSESFDVFTSWDNEKDRYRVENVKDYFEKMWDNQEPQIKTLQFPELTIEKIKSLVSNVELNELIEEVKFELDLPKNKKWIAEKGPGARSVRPHQDKVLDNWEINQYHGLFEMCTGAGKTFTAMCAMRDSLFNRNKVAIIVVPTVILFKQWYKELKFVFKEDDVKILPVGAGYDVDISKIKMYSNPRVPLKRCIITTYTTAVKEHFINNIMWGEHILLICDEVHNIGSTQNRKLMNVIVGENIGLSATPKRYFDDDSTQLIMDFFRGVILPKYEISDALKDKVLCEYFYDIYEVKLTQSEQEKWNELTDLISRRISINNKIDNIKDIPGLEKLLFQRADIIKKAENKLYVAEKILLEQYSDNQRWLVYLDDTDHVSLLKQILDKHIRLKDKIFEYHTNSVDDLEQTLKEFSAIPGSILLAINCLDEGFDIPEIDHAIILSSSKNPRQYIQRRGRVLRTHKNKHFAYIFDCIVLPNTLDSGFDKSVSILRGEIVRCLTFAKNAKDGDITINKIKIIMNNYYIDDIEGEYGIDE